MRSSMCHPLPLCCNVFRLGGTRTPTRHRERLRYKGLPLAVTSESPTARALPENKRLVAGRLVFGCLHATLVRGCGTKQ
jgi:hypothetical protein